MRKNDTWSSSLTLEDLKKIISECFSYHSDYSHEVCWMILWVGRVFKSEYGYFFNAVVVPLEEEGILTKFSLDKLRLSDTTTVNLPLRIIRLLPAGTIIQDGTILFNRQNTYFKADRFDIDVTGLEPIKFKDLGSNVDVVNALGFDQAIKGCRKNPELKSSNVIVYDKKISIGKKIFDRIIFNAAEVARLYSFPSTRMVQYLLEPGSLSLTENKLWVPGSDALPTEEKPYHYFLIRNLMHLRDAPFLARMIFNPIALRSASMINQSVILARQEGSVMNFFLNSNFPFQGTSQMVTNGIAINHNGQNTYIVLQIRKCSGSWPFEVLRYDRESPTPKADNELPNAGDKVEYGDNEEEPELEDDLENNKPAPPRYDPRFDSKDLTTDAGQENDRRTKNLQYVDRTKAFTTLTPNRKREQRFVDVAPKNVKKKTRKVTNISTSEKKKNGSSSTNLDVVSDPDKEDDSEEKGNEDNEETKPLEEFMKNLAIKFIERGSSVQYFSLESETASNEVIIFEFKYHPKENEELSFQQQRYMTISTRDRDRPRKLIIMNVIIEKLNFLVCEIESKTNNPSSIKVIYKKGGEAFEQNDVVQIVNSLIIKLGDFDDLPSKYIYRRFYHASVDGCVDRIIDNLKS